MFKVTNSGTNPLVFSDRFGGKVHIAVGETKDADLDQATGEWIAELQDNNENVTISGSADTSPRPKAQNKSGKESAIRAQTMGDPSKGPQQQALVPAPAGGGQRPVKKKDEENEDDEDELPSDSALEAMKRSDLNDFATERGIEGAEEMENKEEVIKAIKKAAKK